MEEEIFIKNYINGELVKPQSNMFLDVYEPAIGKIYAKIPRSDKSDVDKAVSAAIEAYPSWSATSVTYRSEILLTISRLIEDRLELLAKAESRDNGKPVWLAKSVDIPRAASNFRFFATSILHFSSESHEMTGEALNYTLRQPIGVVGAISPWNLPLYLFTWKIAPALAVGNTVIAKPSEITPYTAYLLSEICIEAGLPKGVLNIVHGLGTEVGEAITLHREIKAISFTGGTKTGEIIARNAAPLFKKLSLEMGGKNPVIIFDDCNFDEMIETTVRSSFSNQGEICLCGSRIYIHNTIYEKFKKQFIEKISKLVVGDPIDDNTNLGAIVSREHYDKILSYIDLAKKEGGTILYGGNSINVSGRCNDGWFIQPTVIEGLDNSCRTNQEEIFGPVVTITPFEYDDQVLQMANSTGYGLASILWTNNLQRTTYFSQKLNSGIVWVNCWMLRDLRTPFGGMKNSGVGREGGFEALRFFTEPKNICIKY